MLTTSRIKTHAKKIALRAAKSRGVLSPVPRVRIFIREGTIDQVSTVSALGCDAVKY